MNPKQLLQAGLLALLATGIAGCGSSPEEEYAQPEFKKERTATFEPITGELPIALVRDMDVYGPYLVVVGYLDNQMVHIYDKQSGELRGSAVRLGRAANEILHMDCVTLDPQTGTLRVYDFQSRKRLSMQIDSLLAQGPAVIESQPYELAGAAGRAAIPLHGKELVINNKAPQYAGTEVINRFVLYDDQGRQLATADNFPIEDPDLRFKVYNEAYYTVSPDRKRFAIATIFGALLETYSVKNGIEQIAVGRFARPDLDSRKELVGFSDLYATDRKIYTAYDGVHNLQQLIESGERPLQYHKVCVFDWKGRPLEQITTDRNICKMCIDEGRILYAAIFDELYRFYLAKIDLGEES